MMFYDYFPLIVMLILDFSPNHNALCYIKLTKIFLNYKALQLGEISLNRTTFHNIKDLVTRIFPLIVIFPLFIMLLNRNTDCIFTALADHRQYWSIEPIERICLKTQWIHFFRNKQLANKSGRLWFFAIFCNNDRLAF